MDEFNLLDSLPVFSTPFVDRMQAVLTELSSANSDRASVLIVFALLDNSLQSLLQSVFMCNPYMTVEALKTCVPQETMRKSRLALSLKLIDKQVHDAINHANVMRTQYAHTLLPQQLSANHVVEMFNLLPDAAKRICQTPNWMASISPEQIDRFKFVGYCMALCCLLDGTTYQIEHDRIKTQAELTTRLRSL